MHPGPDTAEQDETTEPTGTASRPRPQSRPGLPSSGATAAPQPGRARAMVPIPDRAAQAATCHVVRPARPVRAAPVRAAVRRTVAGWRCARMAAALVVGWS